MNLLLINRYAGSPWYGMKYRLYRPTRECKRQCRRDSFLLRKVQLARVILSEAKNLRRFKTLRRAQGDGNRLSATKTNYTLLNYNDL